MTDEQLAEIESLPTNDARVDAYIERVALDHVYAAFGDDLDPKLAAELAGQLRTSGTFLTEGDDEGGAGKIVFQIDPAEALRRTAATGDPGPFVLAVQRPIVHTRPRERRSTRRTRRTASRAGPSDEPDLDPPPPRAAA